MPHQENSDNAWNKIIQKALREEKFKQRLLKDPKSVLKENGIQLAENVSVTIHENTKTHVHFVLPDKSRMNADQLKAFSGGLGNIDDLAYN